MISRHLGYKRFCQRLGNGSHRHWSLLRGRRQTRLHLHTRRRLNNGRLWLARAGRPLLHLRYLLHEFRPAPRPGALFGHGGCRRRTRRRGRLAAALHEGAELGPAAPGDRERVPYPNACEIHVAKIKFQFNVY